MPYTFDQNSSKTIIVFRGESRPPYCSNNQGIFAKGLQARNQETEIKFWDVDTGFEKFAGMDPADAVCLTPRIDVAALFPHPDRDEHFYIYLIKLPENEIFPTFVEEIKRKNNLSFSQEMAIKNVLPEQIIACVSVKRFYFAGYVFLDQEVKEGYYTILPDSLTFNPAADPSAEEISAITALCQSRSGKGFELATSKNSPAPDDCDKIQTFAEQTKLSPNSISLKEFYRNSHLKKAFKIIESLLAKNCTNQEELLNQLRGISFDDNALDYLFEYHYAINGMSQLDYLNLKKQLNTFIEKNVLDLNALSLILTIKSIVDKNNSIHLLELALLQNDTITKDKILNFNPEWKNIELEFSLGFKCKPELYFSIVNGIFLTKEVNDHERTISLFYNDSILQSFFIRKLDLDKSKVINLFYPCNSTHLFSLITNQYIMFNVFVALDQNHAADLLNRLCNDNQKLSFLLKNENKLLVNINLLENLYVNEKIVFKLMLFCFKSNYFLDKNNLEHITYWNNNNTLTLGIFSKLPDGIKSLMDEIEKIEIEAENEVDLHPSSFRYFQARINQIAERHRSPLPISTSSIINKTYKTIATNDEISFPIHMVWDYRPPKHRHRIAP